MPPTADATVYLHHAFRSIALLFVAEENRFPHAHLWQAFLSASSSPFLFSMYVAAPVPETLPDFQRDALLAVGANILAAPSGQDHELAATLLRMLHLALREQPHAARFCLLSSLSMPVFNFTTTHLAIS